MYFGPICNFSFFVTFHKRFTSFSHIKRKKGNHAQALALAAHLFNTTAHVIMPTISTPSKIAATKGYGAKVYFSGSTVVERIAAMEKVRQETGAVYIPPYDHPDIICGQGTMALELEVQAGEMIREREMEKARRQEREAGLSGQNGEKGSENNKDEEQNEQQRMENGIKQDDLHLPHLDAVIAPLGGGGMLSGISTALHPTPTHVYGVEPSHQGADDARRGLASTPPKRIEHVKTLTIADGLRTPLGKLNWNIISNGDYVKGVYAVTDDQIRRTMKLVLERMKIFVEPSAVVGLAMALFDEEFRTMVEREGGERGWDVGIVFSGGNVSVEGIAGLFAKTETETETETEKKTEKQEGSMSEVHGNETENTKPVVVNEQERSIGKVGMDGERKAEDVAG